MRGYGTASGSIRTRTIGTTGVSGIKRSDTVDSLRTAAVKKKGMK